MNFAGSGRALNSRALARSYRHSAALHRPAVRASVTAGAALAGWQYGRSRGGGWWRHGNGGYGWVGPLFWPFAYFDIYDYALWGPRVGAPFWYYGYDDIYAGLFGPYDYQGLAGYLPPRGSSGAAPDRLALLCGEDSREIAGLPIDLIAQAIEPTEPQRAALDDLANASVTSAQKIKAACPTTVALTASGPARLDAATHRGNDIRCRDRAAGARQAVWPADRRAESADECGRRGSGEEENQKARQPTNRCRPAT